MPWCQSPTSPHVKMLGWDVANICALVVFVASVRVVEFGSKWNIWRCRPDHGLRKIFCCNGVGTRRSANAPGHVKATTRGRKAWPAASDVLAKSSRPAFCRSDGQLSSSRTDCFACDNQVSGLRCRQACYSRIIDRNLLHEISCIRWVDCWRRRLYKLQDNICIQVRERILSIPLLLCSPAAGKIFLQL